MNTERPDGTRRARATEFGYVPTFDPARLRGFEPMAVRALDAINLRLGLKERLNAPINGFNAWWIWRSMSPITEVDGTEHVLSLQAPKGLVLVSNHRSFFDMYVCSSWLVRHTSLARRFYFPVRSEFFYDNPLGVLLNLGISAGSMWPPVFRDDARRNMNPVGMAQLAAVLGDGAVVGVHPEGRRGKGDDPYTFLPIKPGLGRLLAACHDDVTVLPYFINGLGNDFAGEILRGRRPEGQRGEQVRITFGTPMTAAEARAGRDAMATTEHVFDQVRELAERDRAARRA